MRGLGLDDQYGHYVERLPAETLTALNAMSLFGLHRRLRGAVAGHLAAFEMTSSIPNRLYGNGFRRHGHDARTTLYFDEQVEADAVHEQIAGRDLAGALAEDEPEVAVDIMIGTAVRLSLDDAVAERMASAWEAGTSTLRTAWGPAVTLPAAGSQPVEDEETSDPRPAVVRPAIAGRPARPAGHPGDAGRAVGHLGARNPAMDGGNSRRLHAPG